MHAYIYATKHDQSNEHNKFNSELLIKYIQREPSSYKSQIKASLSMHFIFISDYHFLDMVYSEKKNVTYHALRITHHR